MNGSCEPPPPLGERGRRTRAPRELEGTQQDETDTNSHGSSGNESNGNESRQSRSSHSSTSGNGKDSAMLEATESSKSTNSHSPSPPSSSIAYSLLSASSEQDNPSTSGCSSEQSAREKNQKDLMKALKELKIRLPTEKRGKGKSGTLATLQYALSCVKQVRANQEYYQQWTIDESQPCGLDMSSFTIEEVESVTSEYTLKNPDTFSVAVSFISGRIVYISDQASLILHCKRDVFKGATFAEFLAPQDVSVFYGSTAPYHLPSWSSCTSGDTTSMDYTQEKSLFCRISGGRERDMNLRYHPFRLTPYLMKVRDSENAEGQPCCLIIAEKIHSGYEAPRIPADKRIFTTRHTTSCVFQEVDERAVPLLGYLPQDLIGMPVLFFIHPEDRPLMLAIHKKVLQNAGQPFDHCPIRLCARSGEYVTIDTSWSSFVNPWSRKVSFILGRHKVRTSPLNEDVFTAPKGAELKPLDPDIQELSEQIHRILMQPVHSTNSAGNGSGGSNTSQELKFHCNASSSDSNAMVTEEGNDSKPMTFQEFCQNVHMVKNQGQQMFLGSRAPRPQRGHFQGLAPSRSIPPMALESAPSHPLPPRIPEELTRKENSNYSYQQINCLDSIIRYLESCNLPTTVKRKCGSSSHTSSEDKQQTRESDKEEPTSGATHLPDLPPPPTPSAVGSAPLAPLPPLPPSKAESMVSITSQGSFSSTIVHVGDKKPPDSDIVQMEESPCPAAPTPPPRPLGLTKEVLSAHTQREEQAFLTRVHNLSQLRVFDTLNAAGWEEQSHHPSQGNKPQRMRHHRASPGTSQPASRGGSNAQGRRSKSGKSKAKRPKPGKPLSSPPIHPLQQPEAPLLPPSTPVMPGFQIPIYPPHVPAPDPSPPLPRYPLVTPIVALVLPNYLFQPPPIAPPFYPGVSGFPQFPTPAEAPPLATQEPTPVPIPPPPTQLCPPPSRSSSLPQPELFQSRCSSPLQLDLLQMEELPQPTTGTVAEVEVEEEAKLGVSPTNAAGSGGAVGVSIAGSGSGEEDRQPENCMGDHQESSSHNDALSSSSDLLDLLLQEDSFSGTGSASGSMGSNGGSTSACGTRSSESSNTSKYFGSIDSSETDLRVKKAEREEEEREVIRYVMQDPLWLLMANADHKVMMSYQIPPRDMESVLQEDREKLQQLQRHQPKFSEEQKRELGEVHSWMRRGRIPKIMNITSCTGCFPDSSPAAPYDEDVDLSIMMEEGGEYPATGEEGAGDVVSG
ncbi:period circadian protein homolog 1 isoform X2 [Bombina bombina]|uniref:period circadian protein homolog 1 isoform X2 n=1 Tax=Bombina bombina TaxID=8345 RepID=UPI00235AFA9D|nr:period circadian protein homolog 1 isoform X2 [Bombina bombina]